ncbi:PHP domain-containing protein [Sedimentibacter sp. MB31-C6]|uniref:PHP domain-containing protein n=1 Tax=Sedimentibacter sp. MB31-C6 TaxID=3109366 RepID=UPI002DDD1C68|nr:PHP domain-containing protein [Sedimentibacter sp. MB36-C1]WSI04939.1 PHP domain-containing protein [Sedimentibacter sp. MB36-C1]
MKKVDMHMHTCASDGTWDVYELKEELKKNRINIFSITDHDNIDNTKKMQEIITPKDNLIYIPGVELTSEYQGREYHLTLYDFDIENKDLLNLINWTNQSKIDSNKEFIKNYASNKYKDICYEDFEKYEYDRKRGGWKSANYMIDKGIHMDMLSHLKDVGESGLKAELKNPEEVMKIIKKSGGKVFLAHPSYHYRNNYMPEEELIYWLELGIDGIECFSPYNENNIQGYIEFCKKNNLMISGGSDCHGEFIKTRKLGVPHVTLEDLNIKKLFNNL